MQKIYYTSFPTSIDGIYIAATKKGIRKLSLSCRNEKQFLEELISQNTNCKNIVKNDDYFKSIKKDVLKYLSGKPVNFDHRIDMEGTDFQKKVWRALLGIPYGRTLTYKQVAEKIGAPRAFRAVGSACGANDLPLLIPCHRIIAAGGRLGGFGAGLDLKKYLLRLEGVELQ